jgi:hypothetical protein
MGLMNKRDKEADAYSWYVFFRESRRSVSNQQASLAYQTIKNKFIQLTCWRSFFQLMKWRIMEGRSTYQQLHHLKASE